MTKIAIEYLTDADGSPTAVVIPIHLWRQLMPAEGSIEELSENIADYCLNRAMDEAKDSPLLNRNDALKFLEDDSD